MNLISIQGHYAPAYWLNKSDADELKKQVETITKKRVLVISSKFRTDIIYYGDDQAMEIIKIWCSISGASYKESTKLKFFYSLSKLLSLTHFFYRLQLLSRIPQWHKLYNEQLLSKWMENPKEPVLDTLIKIMILLKELNNEHVLKLDKAEFQQVVESFIDLKNLSSSDSNLSN